MTWKNHTLIGPQVGALRGLAEVGAALGNSHEGVPQFFLTQADNVAYTNEGRLRKRPGRHTVSNFTGRSAPKWVGATPSLLYDADANALRQGATSVLTGLDAGALCGAVYTSSAATVYLLVCDGSSTVRKISGTTATAITGFPASSPSCVAVAGRRVFFAANNTVFWSTFSPTLTTSGEWPSDNELSIADKGIQTVKAMVEFGGYLYLFGAGAVAQMDPRSPEQQSDIVLSGFGINHQRAVVAGKDRLFFTDGSDIYHWSPGGQPRSIATLGDGRSLVRGAVLETSASDPYNTLGYDAFYDLLFVSNSSSTLVYSLQIGAWAKWNFGASCWTSLNQTVYLTQSSLSESLSLDWTKHQDTLAGVATPFAWTARTGNLATGRDSRLALKKLRLGYPGDTNLSQGAASVAVVRDGGNAVATGNLNLEISGVFTLDGSLLGGDDVLGGAGTEVWSSLSLPYPEGSLLGVSLSAHNNLPFQIWSLNAQVSERHVQTTTA